MSRTWYFLLAKRQTSHFPLLGSLHIHFVTPFTWYSSLKVYPLTMSKFLPVDSEITVTKEKRLQQKENKKGKSVSVYDLNYRRPYLLTSLNIT